MGLGRGRRKFSRQKEQLEKRVYKTYLLKWMWVCRVLVVGHKEECRGSLDWKGQ